MEYALSFNRCAFLRTGGLRLGGNEASTRLNRLYKESVKLEEITDELRPLLRRFAQERAPAERFGDWCRRAVLNEPPATTG